MTWNRWLVAICGAIAVSFTLSRAAESSAPVASTRPDWCRPGYVCITREDLAKDTMYHYDLQDQVAKYRSRANLLGWTVGPGLGIAGIVDRNYQVSYIPTGGIFVV